MRRRTFIWTTSFVFMLAACGDDSSNGSKPDASWDASAGEAGLDAAPADGDTTLDSGVAEPDGGQGQRCTGTCTPCDTLGSEAECQAAEGCTWGQNECVGPCTPCDEIPVQQCETQIGCHQEAVFRCEGTCTPCDQLGTQMECNGQQGCTWTGTCQPSVDCSAVLDERLCDSIDGCNWTPGTCTGRGGDCTSILDPLTCRGLAGCQWDSNRRVCVGTADCGQIDSQTVCVTVGCQWSPGSCSGTPNCNTATPAECRLRDYCTWDWACSGTCWACSAFTDQNTCEAQRGCAWSGDLTCQGSCAECTGFTTDADCNAQDGCSWLTSGCGGTCAACDTFTDEASCTAQPGCTWQ